MTDTVDPPVDQIRIILIRFGSNDIALAGRRGAFALPRVSIPRYSRHAEEITRALLQLHQARAYCLFTLPSDLATRPAHHYCFCCLAPKSEFSSPNFHWMDQSSIGDGDFADGRDFKALEAGFELINRCRCEPASGYFGRPGWMDEIAEWSRLQATRLGIQLTGSFSQLNASASSSLVRFDTVTSAVWFKASGEPNRRELPITEYLSGHFPGFVPSVISTHSLTNGWLSVEVPGSHVSADSGPQVWIAVADALSDLQRRSVGHGLHLLEADSIDVRPLALVDWVRPFLDVMGELMDGQIKPSPAPLTHHELRSLGNVLCDALYAADALDLPPALVNLDFNLGNIIAGSGRVTFLDWASGAIGNPFFSFEYFLEQLRTARPADRSLRTEISNVYLRRWRSLLGEDVVAAALAVTPLLAAFGYAASSGGWRDLARLRDPVAAGHWRSITRRMKREAEIWTAKSPQSRDLDPQPR